jgi:hypothetical protein
MMCVGMGYCVANVELLIEIYNNVSWDFIIWYGRYGVCGQGLLRSKCRIVKRKYATVGVGRL